MALLLATFLALGQLNKFGELTAMRTAGRSLVRILGPVFVIGVCATVVSLLLGELVVPGANRERDRIYDLQIQRIERPAATERADVTYLGEGGRIYIMHLYLIHEQRMHEVSLQEFRAGDLLRGASMPRKRSGMALAGCSTPAICARSKADTSAPSRSIAWP